MTTTVTKTVKPSGGDYTSLSAWEAGEQGDLVTLDQIRQAECYSMSDTTATTIDGWTTDATRYIRVYTPISERHDGKWNTAKYRLGVTTGSAIVNSENNCRLEGLQVKVTRSAASATGVELDSIDTGSGGDIRVSNSILWGVLTGNYGASGIGMWNAIAAPTLTVWNNVIYGWLTATSTNMQGIFSNVGTVNAYNNTVYDCYQGYNRSGGTFNAINCGAAACTTGFVGTITQTTCSSTTPTFVDEANDDFHLAPSDVTWKNVGTSDPGAGLFSDDIDGQTRAGSWDIGADEFVAAGVGARIPYLAGQGGRL